MRPTAALDLIRDCVAADRVIVTEHFAERMAQRGLFWTDLLAVIEEPTGTRTDGVDAFGRERWFVVGEAPDDLLVELLCAIDVSDPLTVLVTIYWEK